MQQAAKTSILKGTLLNVVLNSPLWLQSAAKKTLLFWPRAPAFEKPAFAWFSASLCDPSTLVCIPAPADTHLQAILLAFLGPNSR